MTNDCSNYGGPGPLQVCSSTIVPINNLWMQSTSTAIDPAFAPVSMASITDGTSNTGLVSERLVGMTNEWRGVPVDATIDRFVRRPADRGDRAAGVRGLLGPAGTDAPRPEIVKKNDDLMRNAAKAAPKRGGARR